MRWFDLTLFGSKFLLGVAAHSRVVRFDGYIYIYGRHKAIEVVAFCLHVESRTVDLI